MLGVRKITMYGRKARNGAAPSRRIRPGDAAELAALSRGFQGLMLSSGAIRSTSSTGSGLHSGLVMGVAVSTIGKTAAPSMTTSAYHEFRTAYVYLHQHPTNDTRLYGELWAIRHLIVSRRKAVFREPRSEELIWARW